METKHTPGPWAWYWRESEENTGQADCGVYAKVPTGAYSICRAPRYAGQGEWSANAALISRAPDLLSENERLRAVCERALEFIECSFADADNVGLIPDLRAALARAEKETP